MAAAPQVPPSVPTPGVMQQATDPLAELRDIHMPGMIETWPPAPGWWLLAVLAIAAVIWGIIWLIRRWQANRYRREAIAELDQLHRSWQEHSDDTAYLEALQTLLKRVALTSFPREDVASLTGEAWVQFLDRATGSHDFSMSESEALIDGNYRLDAEINVDELQSTARLWIRKHHPRYFELEQSRQAA